QQPVVAGVEPLLVVVEQLAPELHRMETLQPRQLLVDLIGLIQRVGVTCTGADGCESPAPSDRTETVNRLASRDLEGGIRIPNAGPVQCVADDRYPVVPEQHFVDERRPDDAVPVESHVTERRGGHVAQEKWERALVVPRLVLGEREASKDLVLVRKAP